MINNHEYEHSWSIQIPNKLLHKSVGCSFRWIVFSLSRQVPLPDSFIQQLKQNGKGSNVASWSKDDGRQDSFLLSYPFELGANAFIAGHIKDCHQKNKKVTMRL